VLERHGVRARCFERVRQCNSSRDAIARRHAKRGRLSFRRFAVFFSVATYDGNGFREWGCICFSARLADAECVTSCHVLESGDPLGLFKRISFGEYRPDCVQQSVDAPQHFCSALAVLVSERIRERVTVVDGLCAHVSVDVAEHSRHGLCDDISRDRFVKGDSITKLDGFRNALRVYDYV
jgi:hypothetical protein